MRLTFAIAPVVVALLGGCAAPSAPRADRAYIPAVMEPAPAPQAPVAALVFDPAGPYAAPYIDRDARRPSTDAGYIATRTSFYLRTEDNQYFDTSAGTGRGYGRSNGGYLQRQSVSETVGYRSR